MITKVGMIILLEHDVDAATDFYKKLGLKQIFHIKESWAEFAIGDVKIGLCPTSQKVQDRITGLVLEVDDVKAFYETYKDEITFKSEPVEKVHGLMVSIQDPGGNIIDLYQPTPEKVQKLVKEVVKDPAYAKASNLRQEPTVGTGEDATNKDGKKGCNSNTCRCTSDKACA